MRPFLTHFARVRFRDLRVWVATFQWWIPTPLSMGKNVNTQLYITYEMLGIAFLLLLLLSAEWTRREFWRKRRAGGRHRRSLRVSSACGEYVAMHMYTIIEIHKRWSVYLLLQIWKYTNISSCALFATTENSLFVNLFFVLAAERFLERNVCSQIGQLHRDDVRYMNYTKIIDILVVYAFRE